MPPLRPAARLVASLLLASALAVPVLLFAARDDALPGALRGLDVEQFLSPDLPPPPTLRLLAPEDGQGVDARLEIRGEASAPQGVLDVQWRLDGGAWASLPEVVAGATLAPFSAEVPVPPGDHLVEVRAYDGEAFSLVARAAVRAASSTAPPTVRILEPHDGQGVPPGEILVRGVVEGAAGHVTLRVGEAERQVPVLRAGQSAGAWSVTLPLPEGRHVLVATPEGGLSRQVRVAVGDPAPPTLRVLAPSPGASFGSAGDPACLGSCILFTGAAPGATDVLVSLDGGDPVPLADDAPGAWTLEADGAWTWALSLPRLLAGEHRAAFTPLGEDGAPGVPQEVVFQVRAPSGVSIVGDDAPRPTHTTLRFTAEGDRLLDVRWLLDGEPAGKGPTLQAQLATPGHHALTVQTRDVQGRAALAHVPLYALNRPPTATLLVPGEPVFGQAELRAVGQDADGRVVAWRWDFGDGTNATGPDALVRHAYARAGVYRVQATPLDDQGAEGAPASGPVTVLNGAPLADFSWTPATPRLGEPVSFLDASADPESALLSRRWDFGDGATAEGLVATHAFATRGPQRVTLTVVDADGGRASVTKMVDVANLAASVAFVHEPQALRTGVEALFVDRSVKEDGALVSSAWDFGHECPDPCGPLSRRHANGTRVLHAFPAPGNYTVNLTVTDDLGVATFRALEVVVHDAPPVVARVETSPAQPRGGQAVRFAAQARDAESGNLTYEWDFGDGHASREAEPMHRYARSGAYGARVSVVDEAGQPSDFPFLVVVLNAKPNATLQADVPPFVGRVAVLHANATDADGRLVRYRFDVDGNGVPDCDGPLPRCAFTFQEPGSFVAHVAVVDDEGAGVVAELPIEVRVAPEEVEPPRATLDAPKAGEPVGGRILLTGAARGPRGVERVEVQLRSAGWTLSVGRDAWMLATGNASWRLFLDTRALPDGEHVLVLRATDAQGVAGLSTFPLVVRNGEPPSLLALEILGAPTTPLREDHEVRGSAWHPDGPVTVRYRLDEGPWRDAPGDSLGWAVTLSPRALGAGWHELRVDARRGLDEHREEVLRFRVADPPPALVVDEPPTPIAYGLLVASGRLVGEGKVLWRLDHDVWRELPAGPEWRLSFETSGIEGGNHTLWLKPATLDGLAEGEPVKHRVRVVNPPVRSSEDRRLLADPWNEAGVERAGEVDLREVAREQHPLPVPPWVPLVALLLAAALAGRFAPPRSRL